MPGEVIVDKLMTDANAMKIVSWIIMSLCTLILFVVGMFIRYAVKQKSGRDVEIEKERTRVATLQLAHQEKVMSLNRTIEAIKAGAANSQLEAIKDSQNETNDTLRDIYKSMTEAVKKLAIHDEKLTSHDRRITKVEMKIEKFSDNGNNAAAS